MAYLLNAPSTFVDEAVNGMALAHSSIIRVVPGGVVRRAPAAEGSVAVVIGGGSGHYPAFAGLVGPGLARAAVVGQVFASPSSEQVSAVARACETGGGVLLAFGNYAGDLLNFKTARNRLEELGIPTRTLAVTDDVASAPASERHLRRGVAGDLIVFKIAAAAADGGRSLDEVERIARGANESTYTIGIAFSGCTLPGAGQALFSVPSGRMALGMGIHGEQGLGEEELLSAEAIATTLVERLLLERPSGAPDRVAVLLNSLGGVKGEELFVLFNSVHAELTKAGIEIATVDIGEFATSFEMAGVSLTLSWLDDEQLDLWSGPSAAPGFRRSAVDWRAGSALMETNSVAQATTDEVRPGSDVSHEAARYIVRALAAVETMLSEHADEFGRLDAVAGDGDHGIGMLRGATAAHVAADTAAARGAGVRTLLNAAARAWADKAGGTSGALWGAILTAAAETLDDDSAVDAASVLAAVESGEATLRSVGGAVPGDKTMLDSFAAFATCLRAEVDLGSNVVDAWLAAAEAATDAAAGTAHLVARTGRARSHGEDSVGTPDPGAVSLAAITEALATHATKEAVK